MTKSIGELASIVQEPTSTIRYWEGEFEWLRPEDNNSKHRRYTQEEVVDVISVCFLLRNGMTIKGIKRVDRDELLERLVEFFLPYPFLRIREVDLDVWETIIKDLKEER